MELPGGRAVSNRIAPQVVVSATIYRMSLSLKKLVLGAVLLVLPFQGVAATMTLLLCHGDAQAHTTHVTGAPDRGTHHDGQPDEGGASGNPGNHLCCHGAVSASPVVALPAALPDFPVRIVAPDLLPDLFVPDRPQRPPLA